ncbi:MAG: aldolase [Streptosporangiales bacterium]|nr:aldolase [Streptosporangiales bacterium]
MLATTRATRPEAIAEAAARRRRRPLLGNEGRLLIVAADHPARGALRVRDRELAMADRRELLERLLTALGRPGVDGVLGTADVLEDLLLLGELDYKIVIGSMNRGGIPGSAFEIDDRFTGYDAASIAAAGFDGGKMLLRIDPTDPATASTLQACSQAVSELAERRLMAMIEPFWVRRESAGTRNDLEPANMIRAVAVGQGLGHTSAYTWLKLPPTRDMEQVVAASTLPTLVLGGDPTGRWEETYALWRKALRLPTVRGLVVGRALLYPDDGDVAAAVDAAVALLD